MSNPVYLTTDEVALRWQLKAKTISNWRIKGIGPTYVKIGEGRNTKVLYRIEDIIKFENSNIKEAK